MFTRQTMIGLAVAAALGAPAAVGAQDIRFSYIEGGIVGGFVNDIEGAGTFTGTGTPLQLEADAGGGGFLSGAWQLGGNLHLFADYSLAGQELEVRGGPRSWRASSTSSAGASASATRIRCRPARASTAV